MTAKTKIMPTLLSVMRMSRQTVALIVPSIMPRDLMVSLSNIGPAKNMEPPAPTATHVKIQSPTDAGRP